MEKSPNIKAAEILVIIIAVLVGYLIFRHYRSNMEKEPVMNSSPSGESQVVVENTSVTGGVLSLPTGFPQDLPVEKPLIESATTKYPDQNARQLSVSYQSKKQMAEKYAEYKEYLNKEGFSVTEGEANSGVRGLFGTKPEVNVSVVISSSRGETLVQISYLEK